LYDLEDTAEGKKDKKPGISMLWEKSEFQNKENKGKGNIHNNACID